MRSRKAAATDLSPLSAALLNFAKTVDASNTPCAVLNDLHSKTWACSRIGVVGAALLPLRWGDFSGSERGETVFIHTSVPTQWWDEYVELSKRSPAPGMTLAQSALAPFTMSEQMRMFEPIGTDRWPFELALKYGMRDGLNCPVGGRWVVSYWSPRVLADLDSTDRAMLFMGASLAAIRLQKLVAPCIKRIGKASALTPRELAVLRALSLGRRVREIAQHLGLGEETVRSHVKKAQAKLGTNDRTHAVAQAMRLHLIP